MSNINAIDLHGFIERLNILRRWALAESHRRRTAPSRPDEGPRAQDPEVRVRRPSLTEIEAALQRISVGRYAVCIKCESVIPRERLLVEPAAICCRPCHSREAG